LDIDGVLNSTDWIRRRPSRSEWASTMGISPEMHAHDLEKWALRAFDPDAVQLLSDAVTKSNARVVISSSWRTAWPLTKLQRMLRYHGFEHQLLGATPDGAELRAAGGLFETVSRGEEISTWLAMLPDGMRVRWVVLDDDDVPGHEHCLVKVDPEWGLQEDHHKEIINLFNTTSREDE